MERMSEDSQLEGLKVLPRVKMSNKSKRTSYTIENRQPVWGQEKDGFSGNPEPRDCLSRWGGECEGLSVKVLRRVLCFEAGEAGRKG